MFGWICRVIAPSSVRFRFQYDVVSWSLRFNGVNVSESLMMNARVLRGQSVSLVNSLMSITTTHCGFALALIKIIKDFTS